MLEPTSGSITIDGEDIANISQSVLTSRLVAVPQEAFIFEGTLRLNIDPSSSISDKDITEVLQSVGLWPVVQRRGGLDAIIHETFFSRGETQLLAFARAMLRKSKVVVMDEATSR